MNLLKNKIGRKLVASATAVAVLASFSSGVFAASMKNVDPSVIYNGAFVEIGYLEGWQRSQNVKEVMAKDGNCYAWLEQTTYKQTYISQTVTLPKNAVAITFDYQCYIGNAYDSNLAKSKDYVAAYIVCDGVEYELMKNNVSDSIFLSANYGARWVSSTCNIKKFAGKEVTIKFVNSDSKNWDNVDTSMGVDNVGVIVID